MATRNKNGTFMKGTVPNPKGRPPKPDLSTTIDNLPDNIKAELLTCITSGEIVTKEQFIAINLLSKAGEGDMSAIKELGERIFGKTKDRLEVEQTGSMTIVEELVSADDNKTA